MKRYFFNEIVEVKKLINQLYLNPNDIACLSEIQNNLLSWHYWLENAVKLRKKRLVNLKREKRKKDNTKDKSLSIKYSISIATRQNKELSELKLWSRHFGNSIPHIYYDKNDLRPYAFMPNKGDLKELSGDLFGKEGQQLENDSFDFAISHGIKVLLNDLTSIMRHGDLTLMDREIPYIIELKQSDACRKKAEKQADNARLVQKYIVTDESESIHGQRMLSKRIEPSQNEVTRIGEINNNLYLTMEHGCNVSKIEEKVYCVSFFSGEYPTELSFMKELKKPLFISLNELKNNLDLSLFYPFTLSIKDPYVFSSFICGYLQIYFFIDLDYFECMAMKEGVTIELDDVDFSFLVHSENKLVAKSYTLTKAIMEFTSFHWAIEQMCKSYKDSVSLYEELGE